MVFTYRSLIDGAVFGLALEFNAKHPFQRIVNDADEIAAEVAGGPVKFLSLENPGASANHAAFSSSRKVINPRLAAELERHLGGR